MENKNVTIYAFNKSGIPGEIYKSVIEEGFSRFGWGFTESLHVLKDKKDKTEAEGECWRKSWFLLDIKPGDWIVHINTPSYGKCIAAQVSGTYQWGDRILDERGGANYGHCIPVDKESIVEFDRNDNNVHPGISRRLKLQGNYWRIYDRDNFFASLDHFKRNPVQIEEGTTKEEFYLQQASVVKEKLFAIAQEIHNTHRGKKLEDFVARVLNEMGFNATVTGSGWGTDHGMDVKADYDIEVPLGKESPLCKYKKTLSLAAQVKSYADVHTCIDGVPDLEKAIERFKPDIAVLFSTAKSTEELERAMEGLRNKHPEIEVILIAGEEFGRFATKNYEKLI